MDRREAKEMYGQVLQQIQAGDPMAAYSVFEQLPFADQMGLYLTPGVGDAIAAVEAGVYNERAKQNFMGGNIGSGLLDTVIGGTAAASTIPFAGKVAEGLNLGAKGLNRGIATLRSRMGDGMSGGGGGRGQSTSRVFRNDGGVSAAEKVDGEVGRLIDQGFEGDNFMYNQDFSVPVTMQARNRKTGEMIEFETIPSQDGSIGVSITKLDNSGMQVETAGRASGKISKLERELATENMSPTTRSNIEAELRRLKGGST